MSEKGQNLIVTYIYNILITSKKIYIYSYVVLKYSHIYVATHTHIYIYIYIFIYLFIVYAHKTHPSFIIIIIY